MIIKKINSELFTEKIAIYSFVPHVQNKEGAEARKIVNPI